MGLQITFSVILTCQSTCNVGQVTVCLDFRALTQGVLFWRSSKFSLNSSILWFSVPIWFYLVFGFPGGQTELAALQLIFNISAFDPASCLMKGNDFLSCYALKIEHLPCSFKQ